MAFTSDHTKISPACAFADRRTPTRSDASRPSIFSVAAPITTALQKNDTNDSRTYITNIEQVGGRG